MRGYFMDETITQLIQNYGYLAIAGLIALENIFPPIPSELILTFTGFMTLTTGLNAWGAVGAATAGALFGALILYLLGTAFDRQRLNRLAASRFGKLLGLSPEKIAKTERYFVKHGKSAAFFGRFVPVVRSLISIPAGMSHFSLRHFIVFTTCGTLIWNTVLIFAGRLAGSAYEQVIANYQAFVAPVLLACAVLAICFLAFKKAKKAGD